MRVLRARCTFTQATQLPANLFGQATASGTIQGTITDDSGAVVVGAEVTATSKDTGAHRTMSTSGSGSFRFELMPAGAYVVAVSKGGFSKATQTLDLLVGQTASANIALKAGAANEVIEVTGVAPIVDQAKTGVSQEITPREVENLPLIGRDVANLAYLAPGVKARNPISDCWYA